MATDFRIAALEVMAIAQQALPVRSPTAARDYWALTKPEINVLIAINDATVTAPGVNYVSNIGRAAKRVAPALLVTLTVLKPAAALLCMRSGAPGKHLTPCRIAVASRPARPRSDDDRRLARQTRGFNRQKGILQRRSGTNSSKAPLFLPAAAME